MGHRTARAQEFGIYWQVKSEGCGEKILIIRMGLLLRVGRSFAPLTR